MIIKKFQAKTEAEAVENAKKELGENVVIMNVRSVKRKGLFSFLFPQMTEITVALEDDPQRLAKKEETVINIVPVKRPETAFSPLLGSGSAQEEKPEAKESSAIEEKLDSLHSLLEQQLQKPDKDCQEEGDAQEAQKDKEEDDVSSEMDRFLRLLYNTMLENEVHEQYANQIIEEAEKANKPGMPIDYVLANVYQKMILKFGKPAGIQPGENGPRIVFFVGPTGVGKTTTIAKIASRFSVEGSKKVAFLTADTYRIAAAEQLRTYANILEVPFRVVYSPEEVVKAYEDYKAYNYIMVDTAGHSYQNETQRKAVEEFLHAVKDTAQQDVFLVLSATTKYKDLLKIADAYSEITDYKLIFTKLDETAYLGNLLNLRLHTGAQLSYVTCGQNVPDDIENFNPQKTVKLLLGGKKN